MNQASQTTEPLSVLYVDDEPDLLALAKIFLERTGRFRLDTAGSGPEAQEKLITGRYDAILSDYQMPGMNGIDLLKYVRERYGAIPFILFTGRGREEIVIQALDNGADFYIQKGGEPKSQFAELQNKIQRAVGEKRAVLAKEESEHRMSDIINFLPDATFAIDREGRVIVWNKAIEEMTGVAAREILGRSDHEYAIPFYGERRKILIDLVFSPDAETEALYTRFIKREGDVIFTETEIKGAGKEPRWVWAKAGPLYDSDGMMVGAIESVRDISDRKKAEEVLVESRDYLNQIFSSVKEGIVIVDAETHTIVDLNPAAATLIGAERREILGKVCHKFICPDEDGRCPITDLNQTVDNSERVLLNPDGRAVPIIKNVVPFQFQGRKRLLETFFDNTQRVSDLEALRQSEEKFRSFVENANDIVYDMTLDGVFTYVSPNWTTILGHPAEEVIGKNFSQFVHPDDVARCNEALASLIATGAGRGGVEYRIRHRDGSWRWHISNNAPIRDATGVVKSVIGIGRDVTDKRRLGDGLKQANRQLSLLSGITRHDILNKISVITGLMVLVREMATSQEAESYLSKIYEAINTIRAQIEFTRVYEDLGTQEPQWQSLDEILKNLQVPEPVTLTSETRGALVLADLMLKKVFFNLLDDSVSHGINVHSIMVKAEPGGDTLSITWTDDGGGIPAEEKSKIFDRGYGTHTGFGLFLSREILTITGITIEENGVPGEGARFEIKVPKGMWRIDSPITGEQK
ncbi:PAS domain S-box protein [uncultured Methanospirillum sp.]|uniref:PAS domain S-box protein n=1 Tax=uncultured Methanospirillum sp. TaxID=262503 RepID=UPI0029C67022|nr:PAS domain S-box protein [uncultured Methanospirillum sp.]